MFYESLNPLRTHLGRVSLGLILLLLVSCAPVTSLKRSPRPSSAIASPPLVQTLPTTATLEIGTELIELEVAETPEQQEIGLMNRTSLAANKGMVFVFDPPRVALFWMKNTLIPLDMIFMSGDRVIALYNSVPPCKKDPCPVYGPHQDVDRVIELQSGRAQTLGIERGDTLQVNFPKKTQ